MTAKRPLTITAESLRTWPAWRLRRALTLPSITPSMRRTKGLIWAERIRRAHAR